MLAQVKLSFKSTSGAKMVATRSLQLTVKKTTRAQKTLDCQLLMVKDGERTAISSRVAELDMILPQYLGVSKAILESVIFCHQDESLWPMSEPGPLKKRFDEIFEALKYTKAIDNLKALRKNHNENLGQFKIMEQHAKNDKDKADKAEKRSQELSNEIEALRVELTDLANRRQDAGNKATDEFNRMAAYESIVNELTTAQTNKEWHQRILTDLRQDLKERTESDQWLQSELDQYEERVKLQRDHRNEKASQYKQITDEIKQIRTRQEAKNEEAGMHKQEKTMHERNIAIRADDIKKSARAHSIWGYEMDLEDMQIDEYMDRIAKLSKDQTNKLEKLRRENINEVQRVQDVLDEIRGRQSKLQAGRKSTKDQILANDRKTAASQVELNNLAFDEGGKASLESKIEDLESRIRESKSSINAGSWDAKIQELTVQLRSNEDESSSLNRELVHGTKRAGDLARLDHLKKETKECQKGLDTMKSVHSERLNATIGQWDVSGLEATFQSILDQKKSSVTHAERQRDGLSRELEQVEFQLKQNRTTMKRYHTEMERSAQAIQKNVQGEPDEYPELLATIEQDRDTRKYDVDAYSIMKEYYAKCIASANSDKACRLCSREFENDKLIRMFTKKLEKYVSIAQLEVYQDQLKQLDDELQSAKEVGSDYDSWVRISGKELPIAQAEVLNLEKQRDKLLQRIEDQEKILQEKKEEMRDAETLSKPVATIARYHRDISSYQIQVDEISEKQQDSGATRTLEEIQERLESLSVMSQSLRSNIDKARADREQSRRELSQLELDLSQANNKLTTATYQLEKRANIMLQIGVHKKEGQEYRDTLKEIDEQLDQLSPQLTREESKRNDIKQRGDAKEKTAQQEARDLSMTVEGLQRLDLLIKKYVQEGGPQKLTRCQREIQQFQQEIEQMEADMKHTTIEINKIDDQLKNHDQTKQSIRNNLKYRQTSREMESLEEQIIKLSDQNAEADQARHKQQGETWQRRFNMLRTEETSKMGVMKAKDDQLMGLLNDWNTDYKDAAFNFRKSHIKVETTKAAVEDLGRYMGALDK